VRNLVETRGNERARAREREREREREGEGVREMNVRRGESSRVKRVSDRFADLLALNYI